MALPKSNRIVKDIDIQNILKKSFSTESSYFRAKTRKNELNTFRLLVVVSKKIAKKANQRNLIKRRIIYIFEKLKSNDKLVSSLDMMIIAKNKEVLKLPFVKIVDDILPLYKYASSKSFTAGKKI